MDSKPICLKCRNSISKFSNKKSLSTISRRFEEHLHYGIPTIRYGICSKNHYTELNTISVDWIPCKKCKKQEELEKKRTFLRLKAKKEKKEIPSFLRNELDRFREEIRSKVRVEVQDEFKEELTLTIKRVVEETVSVMLKKQTRSRSKSVPSSRSASPELRVSVSPPSPPTSSPNSPLFPSEEPPLPNLPLPNLPPSPVQSPVSEN
jgi:hypothetical protein